MNFKKPKPPGTGQPLKQSARLMQMNSVAQPKILPQYTRRPVAPPVYRPQPVPKVLQAKIVSARPTPPVTQRKVAAPSVYKPQAPPKVLQLKKPVCISGRTAVAPPVTQKLPVPKVLQSKRSVGGLHKPGLATSHVRVPNSPAQLAVARHNSRLPIMQHKSARSIPATGARGLIQRAHEKKAKGFTPMDLKKAAYATVTAMLYIDKDGDGGWECHGKFTSDKTGHAEEQLLTYLNENEKAYFGEEGEAKVVIELTTSPCGIEYNNCAGQLMSFVKDDAAMRGIDSVKIKTLGFYKGAKDAMYDAAEIKSAKGMDFDVWDVLSEMRHGATAEGYDNSESLQSIAAAHLHQEGRCVKAIDKSERNKEEFAKFVLGS